jgi:hypothetical protein
MDRFANMGSTSSNECFHSVLYSSSLLNKAHAPYPLQVTTAIHLGILWYNDGEQKSIQTIHNIAGIDVSPKISTQMAAREIHKKNIKIIKLVEPEESPENRKNKITKNAF